MPSVMNDDFSGSEPEEQFNTTGTIITTTAPMIRQYQSISGWIILGVFLMVCMVFFMFCCGKRIESMCNSCLNCCKSVHLCTQNVLNWCCCRSRTIPMNITSSITVPITLTKYKSDEEEECNICLDKINNKTVVKLKCGHYYHKKCITKWFTEQVATGHTPSCPSCRSFSVNNQSFSKVPPGIIVFR